MKRRCFLTAAAAMLPLASHAAALSPRPLIKPRRLNTGDVVALVSPAGALDDAGIERRVRNLESLGFKVKYAENLRAQRGNFAGTAAERVSDLHDAFLDPDVKGIWAARGGSGCNHLLPHLNYRLIAANPKVLVGFSDITALHHAIYRHSRVVTFHGPTAGSTLNEYTRGNLLAAIMEAKPSAPIEMAAGVRQQALTSNEYVARVLRPGVATGPLVGGNLSVVAALAGTRYWADHRGALAFYEEVNEEPYRIDRIFTQLAQIRPFSQTAGVLLGVFRGCSAKPGDRSLSLAETVFDHFGQLPRPAVYGYSFGHIPFQMTLPIGIRARLDTASETVSILESAVT